MLTTYSLGTALQNFGTRADSFEHGRLDLHGKTCSSFFNVHFWTVLLNCESLRSYDFRRAFAHCSKQNMAHFQVQKAIVCIVFKKSETACRK